MVFTFLTLLLSNICQADKKKPAPELINLEAIVPLQENTGYLLVDLDLHGVAPSFNFSKIKSDQPHYLAKEPKKLKLVKLRKIDLKNKSNGLYILAMPTGLYQITRINAPYFDLPYRLTTDNRRDWRFSIEDGKLNYIGKLFIDKERSAKRVTIRLYNRIATDKAVLDERISQLQIQYPLTSAAGVRDDFYLEMNKGTPMVATNNVATISKEEK